MSFSSLTQAAVDEAADIILISGDRPTPERVRAFIGTGTPEIISGLLEAWWERLGTRILAPPDQGWVPPAEVLQAATLLWVKAVSHAREELSLAHENECRHLRSLINELEQQLRSSTMPYANPRSESAV
jgi:hypothetical protein